MKRYRKFSHSPAQAIVEFALILTVLLMMIFIVIESARILWAWNQVQNAAREGARYAITGRSEPTCPITLPKFNDGGRNVCGLSTLRTASIISKTHTSLSGLPLNEQSTRFEDENFYNIEVYGVEADNGQLLFDFGGDPNQPVVVRVTYQVPIITPFFRPIRETVPVFGQVTLTNESFGQLGGNTSQGQGLPPIVPEIPTAGVTPTPTATNTPGPTATPTETSTPTATSTPDVCQVEFEGSAVAGNRYVYVTGEPGSVVTIVDATTGETLGSMTIQGPVDGHACPGFADFSGNNALTQALIAGHVLIAQSSDGSNDTTIVLPAPPTVTFTPTNTPAPSATATSTSTTVPTSTPTDPFIQVLPTCGNGPTVQFTVTGINWPDNEDVSLFWDQTQFQTTVLSGHGGFFSRTWTFPVYENRDYIVRAISANWQDDAVFKVPCSFVTPTPAPATPTSTPAPADLIISRPTLIDPKPITAYTPVDFSVVITNVGDIDVSQQFFIDLFVDPSTVITSETESIPLSESDGYSAVSGLEAGSSRTITIEVPAGFPNLPQEHLVYGMVDSVQQVDEFVEVNNISEPYEIDDVVQAATPTPVATAIGGDQVISGVVKAFTTELVPQWRASVQVISGGAIFASGYTDGNGYYEFDTIPAGSYSVKACVQIDNQTYSGMRTNISPPNIFTNIYLLPGPCS